MQIVNVQENHHLTAHNKATIVALLSHPQFTPGTTYKPRGRDTYMITEEEGTYRVTITKIENGRPSPRRTTFQTR